MRTKTTYDKIIIIRGECEVMGPYVLVQDIRLHLSHTSEAGYVLDFDSLLKFSINRIGATAYDLGNDEKLVALANEAWNLNYEAKTVEEPLEMTDNVPVEEEPIEGDYYESDEALGIGQ